MSMQKIAIIGAGISGLTVANELTPFADVTVFDKSRGLGGRMATRRTNQYHFDHGAQYFVAKTEEFQEFLKQPLSQGYIERWDANYVELSGSKVIEARKWSNEPPHYVGTPTMSRLAHFMAKGLTIKNGIEIKGIGKGGDLWLLTDITGEHVGTFDWVICTCPVKQTRNLLPPCFEHHERLSDINMQACFSVMLGFEKPLAMGFQAGLVRNSDISWIAVNSDKPQRPEGFTLMIQSSNEWAEEHQDTDKGWVKEHLIEEAEKIVGFSLADASHEDVHRWLYANTVKQKSSAGGIFMDEKSRLAAVGDWCGNARVESAFTHSKQLAKRLQSLLS